MRNKKTWWQNFKNYFLLNRFVKIALILLFAGFFLGYSMRYLDFVKKPILQNIGVVYPIEQQYSNNFYPVYRGVMMDKSISSDMEIQPGDEYSTGYDEVGKSPINLLYVMRNNVISSLILIATGVLIGIPSIIYLFIIGLSAGASIPAVLEFAPFSIGVRVIFCFILYAVAVLFATSIGIELGKIVLDFIRGKEIKVEKSIFDRSILVIGLVIVNITLQYVLLVI